MLWRSEVGYDQIIMNADGQAEWAVRTLAWVKWVRRAVREDKVAETEVINMIRARHVLTPPNEEEVEGGAAAGK